MKASRIRPGESRIAQEALRLAFDGLQDRMNDPVALQRLAMLVARGSRAGMVDPGRIAGMALSELGIAHAIRPSR